MQIAIKLAAGAVLLAGMHAAAVPLQNGTFGTGDLTGWTVTGNAMVDNALSYEHTSPPLPPDPLSPPNSFQAFIANGGQLISFPFPVGSGSAVSAETLDNSLGLVAGALNVLKQPGDAGNVVFGSAIQQTFTGNAGQTVNFSFDFMTAGANLRLGNDFAFVMLDGTPHRLANTFSLLFPTDSASDFFRETRFQRASLTLVSSGPHTLAFGVVTVAQPNDTLGGSAVWIDNIVVRGVPEPSSVAVLLAGLVGVSVLIRTRVGH